MSPTALAFARKILAKYQAVTLNTALDDELRAQVTRRAREIPAAAKLNATF